METLQNAQIVIQEWIETTQELGRRISLTMVNQNLYVKSRVAVGVIEIWIIEARNVYPASRRNNVTSSDTNSSCQGVQHPNLNKGFSPILSTSLKRIGMSMNAT